jgi:hypothetical protein
MLSRRNSLIVDALSEGIVLYKTSELMVLEEKFRELVRACEDGFKKSRVLVILPRTLQTSYTARYILLSSSRFLNSSPFT